MRVCGRYFSAWVVDPTSKYHTLIRYLSVVKRLSEAEQREEICKLWSGSGEEASSAGTCASAGLATLHRVSCQLTTDARFMCVRMRCLPGTCIT